MVLLVPSSLTTLLPHSQAPFLLPQTNTTLGPGDYFSPGDPLLRTIPSDLISTQCSPHPLLAILYFCLYVVVCAFVMLNLIIAIILENMAHATSAGEMLPSKQVAC